jgi:hypothetical protein
MNPFLTKESCRALTDEEFEDYILKYPSRALARPYSVQRLTSEQFNLCAKRSPWAALYHSFSRCRLAPLQVDDYIKTIPIEYIGNPTWTPLRDKWARNNWTLMRNLLKKIELTPYQRAWHKITGEPSP